MDDIYSFLMFEFSDISDAFDDPTEVAHQTCVLLSVVSPVPETFFRLYLAPLNIDSNIFMNAAAYFTGCGKLHIICDCLGTDQLLCDIWTLPKTEYYMIGQAAKAGKDMNYSRICDEIFSLSSEIL